MATNCARAIQPVAKRERFPSPGSGPVDTLEMNRPKPSLRNRLVPHLNFSLKHFFPASHPPWRPREKWSAAAGRLGNLRTRSRIDLAEEGPDFSPGRRRSNLQAFRSKLPVVVRSQGHRSQHHVHNREGLRGARTILKKVSARALRSIDLSVHDVTLRAARTPANPRVCRPSVEIHLRHTHACPHLPARPAQLIAIHHPTEHHHWRGSNSQEATRSARNYATRSRVSRGHWIVLPELSGKRPAKTVDRIDVSNSWAAGDPHKLDFRGGASGHPTRAPGRKPGSEQRGNCVGNFPEGSRAATQTQSQSVRTGLPAKCHPYRRSAAPSRLFVCTFGGPSGTRGIAERGPDSTGRVDK